MADNSQEKFVFSPTVGRGRGLFSLGKTPLNDTPGAIPKKLFGTDEVHEKHKPLYSTPTNSSESTTNQLRELIGELGNQIGESIAGRLSVILQLTVSSHRVTEKRDI